MGSVPPFYSNTVPGLIGREDVKAFSEDPLRPMLNRVMNENYHPGSTFKTIISFVGLENGVINPESSVFCGGSYSMGKHRWRCDKSEGHRSLDLRHAPAQSWDVYYYSVGGRVRLGAVAGTAGRFGY